MDGLTPYTAAKALLRDGGPDISREDAECLILELLPTTSSAWRSYAVSIYLVKAYEARTGEPF